jgi:acetyltransferase
VVITAGFREVGGAGVEREASLMRIAEEHGMRMVGPNCMGVLNTEPGISMNATFAPTMPPHGGFAFMSQSGALGLSVLDYAHEYGIGISQFVSVGNKPDVSGNDLLLQWEADPAVSVILMYVENFGNPKRFLEIATRVTRRKPIIALKSGRSGAGATAATSHTGALAASDASIAALLQQAGVLRAGSMEELFDMAIAFGAVSMPATRRTAILTNAGGPGILAADALSACGVELPRLEDDTVARLAAILPAEASLRNPLDMIASARPQSYRTALEALLADSGIDSVVAMFVPPMGVRQQDVAEAIVAAAAARPDKPVIAVLMGLHGLPQGRAELRDAGIPAYIFPESAARGLSALQRYAEMLRRSTGNPPEIVVDRARAASILSRRPLDGVQLDQVAALQVLSCYGIPVAEAVLASHVDAALAAAKATGYPVAMKVVSTDVIHKSDVGGVRLDIRTADELRESYREIMSSCRSAYPHAAIDGVMIQRMHKNDVELIVGASRDRSFGTVLMFGLGGVFVEALHDVAFRIAPLRVADATDLVRSIRGQALLDGFRGSPPIERSAVADVLLRVDRLLSDFPEISQLDVNPLVPSASGLVALDARIILDVGKGPT